ncbi:hypothetical protein [Streptomyces malaysiensis]|uniref:hypothetical protein n=1 Tax=Streptomyces malaysiensis TaxID=92644 RepID=UPI000BFE99D1|nr:hypothetical protein [Streptomyces malaysiensis]ATL80247.1 FtsK [Streptomyces malaysiensis]
MAKKNQGALDWTGSHTPAWAAINAAGVSAVVAAAGHLADAPVWVGAAEGATGALASLAVSTARRYTRGNRVYRCAAWLAAGGWTSWAMQVGPWSSWWPALTLGAGAILGWGCNAAYDQWETDAPERQRLAELQAAREKKRGEWEERLERVCHVSGCEVLAVENWTRDAGYTVEIGLPSGGVTVEEIARFNDALRADMRLPRGCTLEIVRGKDHGTVLIRVNTRDVLADTHEYMDYYREDPAPKTINGPLTVGLFRDASPAQGILRSHCQLVIGQPEGGKTNLLNVENAELARCTDCLIWHIDITGAGLSLPWLRAWAIDGTAAKPVVDWTASTVQEAIAMLKVANEIIAMRKTSYQAHMFERNDDKLEISPELPAIIIVVDEMAQLPMSVMSGLDDVNNTGRAVAVRSATCALRGTRDMVSASQKEMTRWRIGMRVSDASEYQNIFSDYRNVDPQDAQVQGSGFMEWNGASPRPFRSFRITPQDALTVSNETANWRPEMDEVSLRIDSARVYRERWARTLRQLIPEGIQLSPAAVAQLDITPAPLPSTTGQTESEMLGESGDGIDMAALFPLEIPDNVNDAPAPPAPAPSAAPEAAEAAGEQPSDPRADEEFGRVLDDAMWDPSLTQNPTAVPADPAGADEPRPTLARVPNQGPYGSITDPAQRRALELLTEAATEGLGATALQEQLAAEGYPTTRQTAQDWLTKWLTRGWLAKLRRDGGRVAYVLAQFGDTAPGERVA